MDLSLLLSPPQPRRQLRSHTAALATAAARHRSYLDKLPVELITSIASRLPTPTVARLSRVSRHLQSCCLGVLYREIFLGGLLDAFSSPSPFDAEAESLSHAENLIETDSAHTQVLLERQTCLLKTAARHPKLGALVQHISWTVIRDPFVAGPQALPPAVWTFFASLSALRSFSLTWAHSAGLPRPLQAFTGTLPAGGLFPRLTELRLAGITDRTILAAILGSPAQLVSLDLRSLEEPDFSRSASGDTRGRVLLPAPDDNGAGLASALNQPREQGQVLTRVLHGLTGRCNQLQTLRLEKPGVLMGLQPSSMENRLLMQAWGEFLESVRETLRECMLEAVPPCGIRCNCTWRGGITAMFNEYVLPILTSPGWCELRKITVRGIAFSCDEGDEEAITQRIRDATSIPGRTVAVDINVGFESEGYEYL